MELGFFQLDIRKNVGQKEKLKSVQLEKRCSLRRDGWTDRHGTPNSGFKQLFEGN